MSSDSETSPLSEPVYTGSICDYSDDVYDYLEEKDDLLIQKLSVQFRVYESAGASEEGPSVTVRNDGVATLPLCDGSDPKHV